MPVETKTIDGINTLKSVLDGTERFAGRDSSGDYRALISSLLTYMRENLIQSYDTGWVACSDWTNQYLGDTVGGNVSHGLSAPISDLLIKVLISTDGTDNNSFELQNPSNAFDSATPSTVTYVYGMNFFQIDNNTIKIQTGVNGILSLVDGTGATIAIDTESYYYKIIVYKLNYS